MVFANGHKVFKWVGAIFACFLCLVVNAQRFDPFRLGEPEPFYRNINTSNGLPSSETYHILQDKNGYIWIATDRGVVRYDGFRFRVFTTKNGLADDVIFKLYEDPKGRIWFVSFNAMLSYWENGKIKQYKYNHLIARFTGKMTTTYKSLRVDADGTIHYAISTLGGITISPDGKMKHIHRDGINEIVVSKVNNAWLPVGYIRTPMMYPVILADEKGRHVIETDKKHGPAQVNVAGNYLQLDNMIYDLVAKRLMLTGKNIIALDYIDNELFIASFKGGVRKENMALPKNHPKRTEYLLEGSSISCTMRDREGGYWFTTLDNGVYYTPNLLIRNYMTEQGLGNIEYSALSGIGPDVYIADPMGCTKITQPSTRIVLDKRRKQPAIGNVGKMLLLNWDEPWGRPSKETGCYFLSCNTSCVFTGSDFVLAGGSKILRIRADGKPDTVYNAQKFVMTEPNTVTYIYSVTQTPGGKIFAGGQYGTYELINKRLVQTMLKDPRFKLRVTSLANHPALGTVVGTRNGGVFFFDRNYQVTQEVTSRNGLLSDLVSCLYTDHQGYLYVGTNRGLTVLQLQKDGTLRHWNITVNQGLPSNEINGVYRYGDRIWIATKKGLATFVINEAKFFDRGGIGLAHLSVDGHIVDQQSYISLESSVQLVTVAIRTDNFSGTGSHKFVYQLRRGGPWLPVQDPEITLNEPRWGDYQVSVKFLNDTGVWSKAIPMISFTVEAPFYAKWYFILLVSLVFLAIVFWIFKSILKRVKQRHKYQTTINQLEQKALRAQMNPHFIFNSLNSIQSFLVYEENEKAERYLLKFAQLIRQTLNNSRESYITIESEIDTLQRYLELEQMRFKDKFDYEIVSGLSREVLTHGIPPMLIQPFVENAVLHGFGSIESGGKIEVRFELLHDHELLCTVDDNGVGRKATGHQPEEDRKSFGTLITAERLAAFKEKYGDDFKIVIEDKTDEKGKTTGTKVILRIPVVPSNEITSTDEV